jgi:hypothetical protein
MDIGEVEDLDLDGLSSVELNGLVEDLQRRRCRLEAAEARVLARWDANRCWQVDGAKSGAAWLAWKQRLPVPVARERLRHARTLRLLAAVAGAWAAGEIDRSHVGVLLGACNPRTAAAFACDHKRLLDAARTKSFAEFKRVRDYWMNMVDADGAERSDEQDRAGREVHLSESVGGMWFGRMTFDPVSGTIVATTLSVIERELFETDWAEAKARLGRDPHVDELGRTPGQRRADAMVEMATRARIAPVGGQRPVPLFTVLAGYETFAGPILELYNRTVITPGTAAALLTEADIERIVFDGPSRVIDVGARRRFYRGALRRAVEVRDRTCFHRTCDDVPERPQIDHIHEAGKGGLTTQTNGRLGCAFHNRWRNNHPDTPDTPDPPDDS